MTGVNAYDKLRSFPRQREASNTSREQCVAPGPRFRGDERARLFLGIMGRYSAFGPTFMYQSAICEPVQNNTSRFLRIFS